MKKFNKSQQAELAELISDLASKKAEIDNSWAKFEEAHNELASAIEEYNGVLAGVTEWRDGVVTEMSDYQGERSDKWQEGDAGQQYQSWIDEWEGVDLDAVEVPELPDAPDFEHIDTIEQLPMEAESA